MYVQPFGLFPASRTASFVNFYQTFNCRPLLYVSEAVRSVNECTIRAVRPNGVTTAGIWSVTGVIVDYNDVNGRDIVCGDMVVPIVGRRI